MSSFWTFDYHRMKLLALISTFVCVSWVIDAKRILAGYPPDALSHLYSMQAYLEGLADVGHEVTILQVAGAVDEVKFSHPNITNLVVKVEAEVDIVKMINSFLWKSTSHAVEPPIVLLLKVLNEKWDLVVVEQLFNPFLYAIATYHKRVYGTPYVQYCSSHPLESDAIANGIAHWWTFSGMKRLGLTPFSMKTLNDDSSLYMSDLFRGFEFGAEAHDFRLVGTIYMAFGSIVDWRTAPRRIVRSLFEALNELTDYRIIISTKALPEDMNLGSHVMLTKWAPQIALLSDSRTRLFISHGGLKSVKEAICGKTPVTYLPLFAEQAHNSRQMVKLGVASIINKYTITKVGVLRELRKVCPCGNYEFVTMIRPVTDQMYDSFGGRELDSQQPTHLFPAAQINKPKVEKLSRLKKTEKQAVGSAETVQLEKEVLFTLEDVEKNWKIYYYGTCRSSDCAKDERIHRYRIGLYHKVIHFQVKLTKAGWILVHNGKHTPAYSKLSHLLYSYILEMIKKYPHKLESHFLPL
ncbi:UDP-glucuronosyltransferase [Aphelenchoides besseyi]|nr:UDP-glucuronosyltransferase [Aphelenchoides besseyi]